MNGCFYGYLVTMPSRQQPELLMFLGEPTQWMGILDSQYTPEPGLVQTGLGNYCTPLTLSLLPCPVAGVSAYRAPLHFSFSEKKVAVPFY